MEATAKTARTTTTRSSGLLPLVENIFFEVQKAPFSALSKSIFASICTFSELFEIHDAFSVAFHIL